jgi:Na+-translocating ferredoxin:NAD+ oxidoreductase RnfC subunit
MKKGMVSSGEYKVVRRGEDIVHGQNNTAADQMRRTAHINSEHAPVSGVIQAGIFHRKFHSRELSNLTVELKGLSH